MTARASAAEASGLRALLLPGIATVLADQSIKFPSKHLKVLQAGGISTMAKHYHPEGNGECFHALLVSEVESVYDDAAVHVEENKPMRLAFRILPLLQIYSKPLHRIKAALAQPPIIRDPRAVADAIRTPLQSRFSPSPTSAFQLCRQVLRLA
ncbi:hypothetical protein FMEXI_402 [Fusarium mexicanum]|uniref:Uncharacterized protein n=1 Tax=Fusarium mexicanum TaxID=751941 RepID=A0A8H5NB53_9HYPO|nr:hypothetical protein FMEXI_402 [Fusarium mexicanum]